MHTKQFFFSQFLLTRIWVFRRWAVAFSFTLTPSNSRNFALISVDPKKISTTATLVVSVL